MWIAAPAPHVAEGQDAFVLHLHVAWSRRASGLPRVAWLALLALAAAACGGSGSPAATPAPAPPPAATPSPSGVRASPSALAGAPSPAASPSTTGGATWTVYHGDPAHTGRVSASLDATHVAQLWQSDALDGDVYAEPLTTPGRVYVATEQDSVYALDASSGRVVWQTHLGSPVPRRELPCGNIDPVGITSTPVVDTSTGTLYAVGLFEPVHHELVALDIGTGAIRFRQPIDPPGADAHTHLSRAALTLANGLVYVSFGGRFGDCGAYHGWVVAARPADGSQEAVYQVPTQREGAIWGTPGPSVDAKGSLYVATGNGSSTSEFDYGNAVIKLSPDLKVLDWFAPSNWAEMSRRDADLGSVSPALVDGGNVFQVGKTGVGYLLRTDHLGQMGGEAFQAGVCGSGAYGGTAYAAPLLYVPCRDGLTAVHIAGDRFDVAWHGPQGNANAPIVVGTSVWSIDPKDGALVALDAGSGAVQMRTPGVPNPGGLPHFITPGYGEGRILAARGRVVAAFGER